MASPQNEYAFDLEVALAAAERWSKRKEELMNKSSGCVALLLALLVCTGCASVVQSSKVDLTEAKAPIVIQKAGYYFLPKVKIRLEGERKSSLPTEELEEFISTETQKVTDDKSKTTTESTTDKTSKKSTIKLSAPVQTAAEKSACTLALKETFTEPDPKHIYSLDHLRDYFADDKVTVTLTPLGFLAKVDISAEDKTGEFVTKLAELAKESAKAFAAVAALGVAKPEPTPPFYFSLVLDPADQEEIKRVNDQLKNLGCFITVSSSRQSFDSSSKTDKDNLTPPSDLLQGHQKGIYFRPALPYTLTFESTGTNSYGFRKIENTLYLPNAAPVMLLDFERVAFGKYTHVVDFENGLLKQMSFSVPSSALGFMTIPIEVAKAIASIPGEILQLKFNVVSKEKDILSKQTELIDSQKKRLEAEEALRKYIEDIQKAKQDSPQSPSN